MPRRLGRPEFTVIGIVVFVYAAALFALGCESPTAIELLPWVQIDGLAGEDTTTACEKNAAAEVSYGVDHLYPASVDLDDPSECWEYDPLDYFNLDIKFTFQDGDHDGKDYYVLDQFYFDTTNCLLDPSSVGTFVSRLASKNHGHDGGEPDSFKVTEIQIPSGAECVFLGIKPLHVDTGNIGSNYDLSVRVWTKLDRDAPTNFTAVRTGNNVDLEWTNQESLSTSIQRREISPSSSDWAEIDWVAVNDSAYTDSLSQSDAGKTYRYLVKHRRISHLFDTARLGDTSDSVDVAMPSALLAGITGPAEVRSSQECTWVGSASGGTTSYSYAWSGDASGTSTMFVESFSSRNLPATLIFTVTDALGWQTVDSLVVTENESAPECEAR